MAVEIHIYRTGVCTCSVCVPGDWTRKRVVAETNLNNPTGLDSRWRIARTKFTTGENNPCTCNMDGTRKHYLLHC